MSGGGAAIDPGLSSTDASRTFVRLRVNSDVKEVLVPDYVTLLEVLREDLALTGTKHGCELGECGACAVLVDGVAVLSCLTLAVELEDREIITVEGLAEGPQLSPVQEAFREFGGLQCGYCSPAMLITATYFLRTNPTPTEEEIRQGLSGVLCRCTGYTKIVEAVATAGQRIAGGICEPS